MAIHLKELIYIHIHNKSMRKYMVVHACMCVRFVCVVVCYGLHKHLPKYTFREIIIKQRQRRLASLHDKALTDLVTAHLDNEGLCAYKTLTYNHMFEGRKAEIVIFGIRDTYGTLYITSI